MQYPLYFRTLTNHPIKMKVKQKTISKRQALKLYDFTKYPCINSSLEDIEGEEWIDIPKFDGYYLISNYSRIKALSRPVHSLRKGRQISYYTKERIVPQSLRGFYNEHTKGYIFSVQVNLNYERQQHLFLVNRLMYHVFIKKIDFENDELRIVHKDGDNLNNRIDNLESSNGTTIFYKSLKNNTRPTKPQKPEKIHNQIGVIKYDLQGNQIQHFSSVTEAAKAFKTKVCHLRKVLTNQVMQIKGFVLRYETDTYNGEYANFSKTKKVSQYTIEGILIKTYESVVQAYQETGIHKDTIAKSASMKNKFGRGFVWRYEGNNYSGDLTFNKPKIPVHQYEKGGKFIQEFESFLAAGKAVNVNSSGINACANGKVKTCGGYVWRLIDQPYHGEYKDHSREKAVTQLNQEGIIIGTYPSTMAAARATGIHQPTIHKWLTNNKPTPSGIFWRMATQEEIEKMPQNLFPPTKQDKISSFSVCQYTKSGEKLATFSSIFEASKVTGVKSYTIKKFINDPHYFKGRFIWRKEGEVYQGELKDTGSKYEAKIVTQYDLQGNKIKIFPSSFEATKSVSHSHSSIGLVLNGKLRSACGFIWQYGEGTDKLDLEAYYANFSSQNSRSKSVSCYDMEGNKIGFYKSLGEASRKHDISFLRISQAVNGKTKTASERIWIYENGPDKIDVANYLLNGEVKAKSI